MRMFLGRHVAQETMSKIQLGVKLARHFLFSTTTTVHAVMAVAIAMRCGYPGQATLAEKSGPTSCTTTTASLSGVRQHRQADGAWSTSAVTVVGGIALRKGE